MFDDFDETSPLDVDLKEQFFHILFNGDRELAKQEITALINDIAQDDRESKMIEIMARIAGGSER
ncbi:hypothetical protein AGMMS50229_04680 [Campylobacterota bacterium]|nr:hypothetical protein AGMMS50229_04680 [Campylobacterota bacterium]